MLSQNFYICSCHLQVVHNILLRYVSDVKLAVGCSSVRIQSPMSAYLPKAHGSSHCTFSLVDSGDVAVVCCNSTFLASTSAGVRTFRLLLYIWCEFTHFTQNFAPRWAAISSPSLTVRLTYLAQSVRIKPNFQGLP